MGKNLERLPHFTRALIKSHLLSCGLTYDDLGKPIIAIANSWNEFNHGHIPQRQIADRVKEGVRAAGGVPLEFNTIGPCDALAQGHEAMYYILPSRGIIADSIEIMLRSQSIVDGLVLISSCDKITPAMLIAALRLDIPCIHICSGTCIPEISFSESKQLRKDFLDGKISEREMAENNAALYPHPGVCPYMGTANTMDIFAEVLGLAISGSSTIPAATNDRMRCAQETGQLAVALAVSSQKPSEIISAKSFQNALTVLASISGSLNQLLHVPVIARQVGVHIDFDFIGAINSHTPQLCTINPSGPHSIFDLNKAGGVPAILKELLPLLEPECMNVEGKSIKDIALSAHNLDPTIIRSLKNPVSKQGGIAILKGNIARQGAALRLSTVPEGMMRFTGPAIVFDSEEQATEAVGANKIPECSVVVVRYEGPKGGPGMREMHRLAGAFVGRKIAIVTDGRFSGATGGLSIGYLRPEAAQGGEIACVEDSDRITIDIERRSIELNLDTGIIKDRMRRLKPWKGQKGTRLLWNYAQNI
ncbi:MAG: dihydroxy-acid dehydratase [Desulfobacterales bacterium]|nr:dihydroxy-acid dehydratase [Desulfobacterales bacterium]